MIATRLRGRPLPFRLGYEGTVLRRRSGRARKHRQIPQVGVELAGVPGPEGDLELLALASDGLHAAGLPSFQIDIGDAGIVRALLGSLPSEAQTAISDALARKDPAEVADACARAGAAHVESLVSLTTLHGGRDALAEGAARLARTPAATAAARLIALFDAARRRGLGAVLTADLGEVRGFAYYTGTIFHAFAPGTGDALGSGGRYDELLARFGWDLPAAGFAVDLDRLREALQAAGAHPSAPLRVVVVGPPDAPSVLELRARGIPTVAAADRPSGLAWAMAWGFTHLLDAGGWVDTKTGASVTSPLEERGER
jgi:ATP phosphoribosyltransferase regulatory subunit